MITRPTSAALAATLVAVTMLLTAAPADADAAPRHHLGTPANAGLASGLSNCVAGDNLKRTSNLSLELRWAYDSSWNRYAYVLNNPIRFVDPNGEDWLDVVNGFANGLGSSGLGNVGRAEPTNRDYSIGQRAGDAAAVVAGGVEIFLGSGGEVFGLGLTASGGGAPVGALTLAGSSGLLAHGSLTLSTGLSNLLMRDNSDTGLSSGEPETEVTPSTDKDAFENVRGTSGNKNKETGEVWVRDRLHKDHYEVYKDKKAFEKGKRTRAVWEDGRLKETF